MLNTLTPIQCTSFWYFIVFTEGWCKFACCLVLIDASRNLPGIGSCFLSRTIEGKEYIEQGGVRFPS